MSITDIQWSHPTDLHWLMCMNCHFSRWAGVPSEDCCPECNSKDNIGIGWVTRWVEAGNVVNEANIDYDDDLDDNARRWR